MDYLSNSAKLDKQDTRPIHRNHMDVARQSDAISIARVICILGVVYVHAWTGINGEALEALRGTPQEMFRWVLMEGFGRSAVPLLGLISGWLIAGSSVTQHLGKHVLRKTRTILLPMILWNVLAILLVSGTAWLAQLPAPVPTSWEWLAQEIFILTRNPDINVQMPFLRDLFLCMLMAPWLVRLPTPMLLVALILTGAAHIAGLGPPILMRASILFFFILGIGCRRWGTAEYTAAMPLWMAALPYALLMPARLAIALHLGREPGHDLIAAIDLFARIAAALFFWRLAYEMAGRRAGSALLKIEPFAFFLFCSHLIVIWLIGPVLGRVSGPLGSPLYPAYLLLQPLLLLAIIVPIALALRKKAPAAASLLSGGRLS